MKTEKPALEQRSSADIELTGNITQHGKALVTNRAGQSLACCI